MHEAGVPRWSWKRSNLDQIASAFHVSAEADRERRQTPSEPSSQAEGVSQFAGLGYVIVSSCYAQSSP